MSNRVINLKTSPGYKRYPKYRGSEVEWLEEIPEHWQVKRLKHLSMLNPEALPGDTDPTLEMVYVDIGGVNSLGRIMESEPLTFASAPSRARRLVRDGDVIVSTVRTYLRAIAPIRDPDPGMVVSTGFAVVRPQDGFTTGYAAYALRAPYFVDRVVANSKGVSFPAINESEMATYELALPPEVEQRAIATFLDREMAKIDALVAKKERLIELLQEKRAALITQVVTKGLDLTVPMKDSGVEWFGKIPAHWGISPLKRYVIPVPGAIKTGPFGSQLLSSEMETGDIKVYNQRTVIDRDFDAGDNFVSEDKFRQLVSFVVEPGDILVTTRGTIGRCAIVPDSADVGILHPCLMRIQLDTSEILREFAILLIQDSDLVRTQLALASNATTIDVIYSETMREVIMPKPPVDEQRAIIAAVHRETMRIDRLVAKVHDAIARINELRTALISDAVTGKIDVRGEVA